MLQNLIHPRIRGKGLAFLDADGREEATQLGIKKFERLPVNHGVEFLVEMVIRSMNGVEILPCSLDELHIGLVRGFAEWINFNAISEQLAGIIWFAILQESAKQDPDRIAA